MDLQGNLTRFHSEVGFESSRNPNSREASFDYCFGHFQAFRHESTRGDLATPEQLETSCLHLGFYLASWGMYRGSTQLSRRSARHLVPIVEEIVNTDTPVWRIDLNTYTDDAIALLVDTAHRIRCANGGMTDTLVTKIMLGVFGCVPAFDQYFRRGFGCYRFSAEALKRIGEYYSQNAAAIDACRIPVLDFITGQPTSRLYPRAKMLDMAFFVEGRS
jgi:hypothetical protein